jgi:hypothetical protein
VSEERLQILKMLEAGQIDAEQASALLAALDELPPPQTDAPSAEDWAPAPEPADGLPPIREPVERVHNPWAGLWMLLLFAGVVVLFMGVFIVTLASGADATWGSLLCGWPLILLGLLVALLGIWSRRATWMHVRIKEKGKRKIAFSFPLPLTLAAWVVRVAQPFVPQLQDTGVDDLIISLRESAALGQPFSIDVQDDEEGEQVQIYIG